MTEFDKIYQPAPEVSVREIEGELLLFHPDHNDLFTMNSVGREIWKAINKKISVRNIIDQISDHFELESKTVEPDVLIFLKELAEKGFILTTLK